MANDMIRMSGMNSGLDTESIINALTANTKLKATKQERNVLKYEATQEAYRDIISKLQNLKNSYFDILKKDSYLSGSTIWNKYSSKTLVNGQETAMAGVSVATTINSQPGEYKVTVNKTAKQAQIKGGSLSSTAKVDTDSLEEGQEYGMTITVGDVEKNIKFTAGANAQETLSNINDKLEEAFGESNASVGDTGNKGMVYVDEAGQLKSRNGKGISVSGVGFMKQSNTLNLNNVKSGTNQLAFQIGDETLNVSFQTLERSYFDDLTDTDGSVITLPPEPADDASDEDKAEYNTALAKLETIAENKARESLGETYTDDELASAKSAELNKLKDRATLAYNVEEDIKESVRYDAFKDWKAAAEADGTYETKLDELYAPAEADHKKGIISGWLNKDTDVKAAYDAYKDSLEEGVEADDIYTWAQNSEDPAIAEKLEGFENKYYGTDKTEAELKDEYASKYFSQSAKDAYETYKAGVPEGEEPLGLYAWAEANQPDAITEAAEIKSFDDWNADNNYVLDKEAWASGNLFKAYKDKVYEEPESYGITAEKLVDHFTESALKNSIGNLETSDGTKFNVTYEDGVANITATDTNGDPVKVSMTIGKNSVNKAEEFGTPGSDAKISISQITNNTKISDLGVEADEDGNYNFSINGTNFTFDSNTTVNDMMKKINASAAGVKMTYSSLDNEFTVTASKYGLDSAIDLTDDTGLLAAIGISSDNFTAGNNLEVNINGTDYEASGNSIEADGSTFTFSANAKIGEEFTISIEKDTSQVKDLVKKFVEEYNKVIEDVYKYIDEKPEKDYYFLAEADKEDLDLSEKQEEKWEEKAKKGLLYHDSTTSTVMTGLRTALMGSVEGLDGSTFSLASLGITTSTDYSKHGMLILDENKLQSAIENNADDIQKLFTDSENGIMKKFAAALDAGVKSTGDDKGSLIRKAGLATGTSATNNEIYDNIKRTKTRITELNKRYENEQNRLWKKYSAMESMLGTLNSQQSSFMSYLGQ